MKQDTVLSYVHKIGIDVVSVTSPQFHSCLVI